jgi:deoxyhypusine synthase
MALANHGTTSPPSNATDAVLKPSEPVPEGSREVQGIDFNDYAERAITVEELVGGYANMGFQATAVGEAVRIINDMVSGTHRPQATVALGREPLGLRLRETPAIPAHLRVGETI